MLREADNSRPQLSGPGTVWSVDERQQPGTGCYETLPAEDITIDQVVAWNMRHWRRALYITQEQLGEMIGWSAANVSAAERSVEEYRDRRRFDAQTIASIAWALGVPVSALFLPPEDDGQGKRYRWHAGAAPADMATLMGIAMHDNDHDTAAMELYRDRFRGAVCAYLEEKWAAQVGQWFAPLDDKDARAEQAARFRSRQAALLAMAAEQGTLAEWLEREPAEEP